MFARRSLALRRSFSTSPPQNKTSNLPFVLLGIGTVSAAAYWYLEGHKPVQEKSPLDPQNFIDLKLKKVVPYNHNSASFVFELPDNQASLLPVASCLLVRASDPDALKDPKGNPVVRPYTPISPPHAPGELTLLVKRYEQGTMSRYIHSLKEGSTLSVKGPILKFPYKANEFEQVALIGGGSGITPFYQLLDHALSDPSNRTKFTLLYANVSPSDIILRKELDALQKKHPKTFEIVYVVDKAADGWSGPTGYINKDLIQKHVASKDLGDKIKIFICGPPGQVAAVAGKKAGMKQGELSGILKELGYTEDQVFKF
jgi:cytochrome-b5 reductase